jgi:hypothetical protein
MDRRTDGCLYDDNILRTFDSSIKNKNFVLEKMSPYLHPLFSMETF